MNRFKLPRQKLIRWSVNFLLVASSITLLTLLINRSHEKPRPPTLTPSARININGIDFGSRRQTLLLALAKDCEYCTASARFYRWLGDGLANRQDVEMAVVFPDADEEGKWYLKSLGIEVRLAHRAHLADLGIHNVPTLALVDQNGVVKNVWIGKLPPKKEAEVMQALGMPNARVPSNWIVSKPEYQRRVDRGEPLILVDLRDREAFGHAHFPGARNIPSDELSFRAANELPKERTIVLYADDDAVADNCYMALTRQDYNNVLILDSKL
jgi:rhodanese-related sulfurtransferase